MPAWVKGQSGNPKGRPSATEALAYHIRKLGGKNAKAYIQVLHRLAHDNTQPGPVQIKAVELLLDRGYGKTPQDLNLGQSASTGPLTIVHEHREGRNS